MNTATCIYGTKADLRADLRWWQQHLRMQDWKITADLVPAAEIPGDFGTCIFSLPDRTAHIKIMRAEDYKPTKAEPQPDYDAEVTLVHELLHPVFARIKPGPETEVVIQQVAAALVDLRQCR